MSNFDRSRSFGYGAQVTRAGTAEVDQGLRAYMLGVYNYMMLGLGLTGLVALGTHMLAVVGQSGGKILALAAGTGALREPAALGRHSSAARLRVFYQRPSE